MNDGSVTKARYFRAKTGHPHNSSDVMNDDSASKARYFSIKTGLASDSVGSDEATSEDAQKL